VFVCPMRLGAGIKNKILQAWAMGKAVVSTPEGLGGLEHEHGRNVLVAGNAESFAQAVVGLLRDHARVSELGAEGRSTIERLYTWKAKAVEFESLMERVVQKRRHAASA
jgi:polysaccharide biosynthesis protein PslH